ncbi:hypothetical protein J4456_00655 [Candidatus Pacearchaeota archaeon]|nr:hypothetical protein [Candidatus Pacearchaeota archaeon]
MKWIKFKDIEQQIRPDQRTVRKLIKQELGIEIANLQILFVTHPPGLQEHLHSHQQSFEILYFFDKAHYKINGNDYEIQENDVIIFEPKDVHGAIPIPHEVRILVVQLPAITDDKKYE